jgi:HD-GYP domain-containing protein (c-di-GMP phosphodiesterase class II)
MRGAEVILRRAALLHDIGKLSVPNTILDKPGKLTTQEWEVMRLHPYYTQRVLERVSGFAHLAFLASTHHEKLDGSGYYRNLRGSQLPLSSRVLVVADIYDALAAKRPYRDALPTETVLQIMSREVPLALDADCFNALKAWLK